MIPGYTRTVSGLSIGLLGGSFDPPHMGHVHITRMALRQLNLHALWWLVSPGNPLKKDAPTDIQRRMLACEEIMSHHQVVVTDIEARLGTRYTAHTLFKLKSLYPRVNFIWLMGADNLVHFHRWERWDWIMRHFPICVLARPDQQIHAGLSPAARRYVRYRLPQTQASRLTLQAPPAWTLITGDMSPLSSSAIRAAGEWP